MRKGIPDSLKPYEFHGVEFSWSEGSREAVGDCPFCGRDGKFSINTSSGQWQCFVCREGTEKGGGNALVFIRRLHEISYERTTTGDYRLLCSERGLLYEDTLLQWQVCRSDITGKWMAPAYNAEGELTTLYVRGDTLYPTPTLGHAIFGRNLYSKQKPVVLLAEGPWDGMALWETLIRSRESDDGNVSVTANLQEGMGRDCNVLAIPGCGSVGESFRRWLSLFSGKVVRLMFDNDHPREAKGRLVPPAGLEAAKRAAKLLTNSSNPPTEIYYLKWGPEGWSSDIPHNYDIRDELCLVQLPYSK